MTVRILSARPPHRLRFSAWTLVLAAVAGCSSTGSPRGAKHIPQPGVVDCNQPRELRMVSLPPYTVEPPDQLEISIRPAVPELSADLSQIRPAAPERGDIGDASVITPYVQTDGKIDLGFLGDAYVAGLDFEQIELKLSQILTERVRTLPAKTRYQVSVKLLNGSQSKSYYVLGVVKNQGKFPITGNDTVLDAIVNAGIKENSIPEKAYLVRPHPSGGPDTILKIDWTGIKERGDTLTNYQVFPGDRIIVPGGKPPSILRLLIGG